MSNFPVPQTTGRNLNGLSSPFHPDVRIQKRELNAEEEKLNE